MTESKAIKICLKHKDPVGFEFLVKLFTKEAYFHALGFMGNSDDAADACQDAFLRAFKAMPYLKKLPLFYPWFYCILKNHCLNLLERRKIFQEKTGSDSHQPEPSFDHNVLLEQHEKSALVWEVLGKLEPEFREILVLKYISEMDYQSISLQLGIPRGTVMSRLFYARKAFKQLFEQTEIILSAKDS